MLEQLRIPTPAGKFDALATGPSNGRGVLLLHGFPEFALEWEGQLAGLGDAGCRAVAVDQRGYSPKARPDSVAAYRLDELVGDVLALADELGWSRFDLVGHDWGAIVAWACAGAHPERVRTLAAFSVPHPRAFAEARAQDEDQQRRSAYISAFQTPGIERKLLANDGRALRGVFEGRVPAEHVEEYVRRLSEPGALTAALNWYRAMSFGGRAAPVRVPTLYAWSTEDVAVGSAAAMASKQHATGPYRFETLEDVSHWIPEEIPQTTTNLLLDHFAEHRE